MLTKNAAEEILAAGLSRGPVPVYFHNFADSARARPLART